MATLSPRALALCTVLAAALVPAAALAHDTGTENSTPSQCRVLSGTATSGDQAACFRCIGRPHYHFHTDLPRRQRCHRENHNPTPHPHGHHH